MDNYSRVLPPGLVPSLSILSLSNDSVLSGTDNSLYGHYDVSGRYQIHNVIDSKKDGFCQPMKVSHGLGMPLLIKEAWSSDVITVNSTTSLMESQNTINTTSKLNQPRMQSKLFSKPTSNGIISAQNFLKHRSQLRNNKITSESPCTISTISLNDGDSSQTALINTNKDLKCFHPLSAPHSSAISHRASLNDSLHIIKNLIKLPRNVNLNWTQGNNNHNRPAYDSLNSTLCSYDSIHIQTSVSTVPVNSSRDYKLHPLHYAAALGRKHYLSELISAIKLDYDPILALNTLPDSDKAGYGGKLRIDTVDYEGRTALMHAAYWSHIDCVKILSEAGADISVQSVDGSTVLHQVAFLGNHKVLCLLLTLYDISINVTDFDGRTPIHWSIFAGTTKCLKILLQHPSATECINQLDRFFITPFMLSCSLAKPDHLKLLLKAGSDIASKDINGMTAIHFCTSDKCLRLILNLENSKIPNFRGKTISHCIADHGSVSMLLYVLSIRSNALSDLDCDGRTPLHWAAVCSNYSVLEALLSLGVDANIQDKHGNTALHYAKAKNIKGSIDILSSKTDANNVPTSIFLYETNTEISADTSKFDDNIIFQDEIILKYSDIQLIQSLSLSRHLYKYPNKGKGAKLSRYFWINLATGQVCWSKTDNKSIKTTLPVDVKPSAGLNVFCRNDFDLFSRHQYSFSVLCYDCMLNLVATNAIDFQIWVLGLKLYLSLGIEITCDIIQQCRKYVMKIENEIKLSDETSAIALTNKHIAKVYLSLNSWSKCYFD